MTGRSVHLFEGQSHNMSAVLVTRLRAVLNSRQSELTFLRVTHAGQFYRLSGLFSDVSSHIFVFFRFCM